MRSATATGASVGSGLLRTVTVTWPSAAGRPGASRTRSATLVSLRALSEAETVSWQPLVGAALGLDRDGAGRAGLRGRLGPEDDLPTALADLRQVDPVGGGIPRRLVGRGAGIQPVGQPGVAEAWDVEGARRAVGR